MSAYFIAGAGTDIGKTFATRALIHAARRQGRPVAAFKPVISGYDPDDAHSDTALIMEALGSGSIDDLSPWRFRTPLSPDMAAKCEGSPIDGDALLAWTRRAATRAETVLIETVGGVMVPLNAQLTTREWMRQAGFPLVLVTGTYVGAISHALTALEAVRAAGIPIQALVVSESVGGADLFATRDSMAEHAPGVMHVIAQPRVATPADASAIHQLMDVLE